MQNTNYESTPGLFVSIISLVLAAAALSISLLSAAPASGADMFKAKCAACHGQDGSGNTAMGQKMKVRDLRSTDVQKQTDDELTAIITNGKPPMPAYSKILTAADIHQIVAYLRSIAAKS
jgi:mono/diheme cytochrome c family protein